MKTISKIAAIALVAVAVVGVNTASAATVAELQAMIAQLTAQIAALSGTPSTTPAAVTFTSNLTVGSKGAEVTALQNFLIGKGYNTLATGYFGPMTKAALAAYQTAKGITPAAGYFGPLTRAAVNGEAVVAPTTGGTTSTGKLSGGDGDFSKFSVLGTPSSEDVYEGQSVKVYGLEFTAKDSDLEVQRAKVTLSKNTGTVTKPWKVLDTLAIYNGSEKLGEVDASNSSNWSETSSGSDVYTVTLGNLKSVVKQDAKAKLYVQVTANGSIDTDDLGSWNVSIESNGLRALNAEGIDVYEGSASTKTFTLKKAEAGDMSITVDSSLNKDKTVTVDDTNDTNGVLGFTADVKSKTGTNKIETVTFGLTSPSSEILTDMISTVRLFNGSTEIGSESASSSVIFDDLAVSLKEGEKTTLTIKFDLNDTNDGVRYQNNDTIQIGSTTVKYVDGNDDDKTVSNATDGGVLTLSTTTVNVEKSGSVTADYVSATKTDGKYTVSFVLTAPSDEDVFVPISASRTATTTAGAGFTVYDSSNAYVATATTSLAELIKVSGSATEEGGYFKIAQGGTATFRMEVVLDNFGGAANAARKVGLTQVNYSLGSAATPTESFTSGLDEDFRTSSVLLYSTKQN